MGDYCVLVSPSANRVYARDSVRLLQSEIRVFNDAVLGGRIHGLAETVIGGVPYISMHADELAPGDIAFLSNMSSLYALFEIRGDLLRPLAITPVDKFGSELVTIQKYPGKTNEHFTKLLLNVAAVSIDDPVGMLTGALRVVDPMCGRGTTLNQSMMYGFDAAGIDIDGKDFTAYSTFIRTWLKNNRLKHKADLSTVTRNKERLGRRLDVSVGVTKESYRAGQVLRVAFVNGDTLRCGDFFKPGSFDVLATDIPYGVQHGSHDTTLSRDPGRLLERAVPEWGKLVRSGGAVGISWNTRVARRDDMVGILAGSGLTVLTTAGFDGFAHRVDQAINRDLVVARKP